MSCEQISSAVMKNNNLSYYINADIVYAMHNMAENMYWHTVYHIGVCRGFFYTEVLMESTHTHSAVCIYSDAQEDFSMSP